MTTTTAISLASALALFAAVSVLWAHRERRYRRQVQVLLKRLEEVESTGSKPPPVDPAAESAARSRTPEKEPIARGRRSLFDVLAGKTSFINRVVEGSDRDTLAAQAVACVHKHLEETLTPTQMADELYISLRALERGLRASLDCTPRQLIVAMKMREAHRRLSTGRYRVSEVAYDLGFASPAHFSRRFKSFHGISPSRLASSPEKAA